jgi:beta-N-acetylhexosaminidase
MTDSPHEARADLGRLLVIGFHGTAMDRPLRERLARLRPSGVILFARNLVDPRQVRRLSTDLQKWAADAGLAPFLIGIDHEGGAIVRMGPPVTPFSGNLALRATDSLDLARRQATAMAEELLALGVNWDFAPCVDVNSNPRNPVIGARSFGADPARVAAFGAAMIDGFQARGVLACAKHFPGHGATEVDSHLGLPVVERPLAELRRVDLVPFRAAIEADVASIMSAHIVFPRIDPGRPATVSQRIISRLLRERMRFAGVVVTDAVDMAGFRDSIGIAAGAVAAINAGVDLLLPCNEDALADEALDALQVAVDAGQLRPDVIEASLGRIARMKGRLQPDAAVTPLSDIGSDEHRRLEREIAERSILILREEAGRLPLSGLISILAAGVDDRDLAPLRDALTATCASSGAGATRLLVTRDLHRTPQAVSALRAELRRHPRSVLLVTGYPGDADLLPEARTVVACHTTRPAGLRAAAHALLGHVVAHRSSRPL